jgi:hypothetical protein
MSELEQQLIEKRRRVLRAYIEANDHHLVLHRKQCTGAKGPMTRDVDASKYSSTVCAHINSLLEINGPVVKYSLHDHPRPIIALSAGVAATGMYIVAHNPSLEVVFNQLLVATVTGSAVSMELLRRQREISQEHARGILPVLESTPVSVFVPTIAGFHTNRILRSLQPGLTETYRGGFIIHMQREAGAALAQEMGNDDLAYLAQTRLASELRYACISLYAKAREPTPSAVTDISASLAHMPSSHCFGTAAFAVAEQFYGKKVYAGLLRNMYTIPSVE